MSLDITERTPWQYAEDLYNTLQSNATALAWLESGGIDDNQAAIDQACAKLDDYGIQYDLSRDDWAEHAGYQLRDALRNDALSVDREVVLDVTYCTGGPAYGVKLTFTNVDDRLELDRAQTWGQDWGTRREYYTVPDDSDAWEYLRNEYEDYAEERR